MTQLVKFMRSSLTCARRFNSSATGSWTRANESRGSGARLNSSNLGSTHVSVKSQQRCLSNRDGHSYGDERWNSQSKATAAGAATILLAGHLAFLGFFEKEEEKEPLLITTIKRSILLIQKGEFKKAEQMLHVALRQAQSLQNEDGITYVYDVMANLAFETEDYDKAQKLFTAVMQRELAKGTPKDDRKIVHMSLKMAKILELKQDYANAESGYLYCMNILQEQIDKETEETDILVLWFMNIDWYAHLMLTLSRYNEALKYMEKAYEMCVKLNGEEHEQTIVLLNDLGSISFIKGNLDDALDYLNKAAEIGKKLPDMEDLASIHINLGNVYIKKGLLDEAKRSCGKGWKLAKSKKNEEALGEAKSCLDEVSKLLTK